MSHLPPLPLLLGLLAWVGALTMAAGAAGVHVWERGLPGLLEGLVTLLAAAAMGALVSAVIGLYEVNAYSCELRFWTSLAIGCAGCLLFTRGLKGAVREIRRAHLPGGQRW